METHTSPLQWLDVMHADPRLVGTALDVLEQRAKEVKRRGRA